MIALSDWRWQLSAEISAISLDHYLTMARQLGLQVQNSAVRSSCRLPHLNFTMTLLLTYNSHSISEVRKLRFCEILKSQLHMVGTRTWKQVIWFKSVCSWPLAFTTHMNSLGRLTMHTLSPEPHYTKPGTGGIRSSEFYRVEEDSK